ncbi:gliding motility-associated C-terminal domain-containing protein [Dyadobacter flavalbus]|uniref:Gliding motility-associated C-terminal domain-containing protein n=1 Tax=Dyadobacter flavalbus TaxID=2579942 RepID=A0A5M8QX24_9BACT|nr:gliding motility-associated C-terminal domain-containing protein [Dyadobacter flavalbus]KAA6438552.1 gliding motility-associated C-terminal domain-containing protein [Dyadobacter flavalbus]
MKLLLHFLFCLWLGTALVFGQVNCDNIGFEQGNLTGWITSYGTVTDLNQKTIYQNEVNGTQNNEHFVTSLSDGNDPKVPAVPMVAPGSTHSIRIGNVTEGSHFSRIRSSYLVTEVNTLFQYKFAVILQNTTENGGAATHEPYQKPGFNILIYDSNGAELSCSNYDIQLQGSNTVDGFSTSEDIQYRNWTTGAIDLRNYVGKSLTIVVTAHGCTRRRHFGYAYFDAECLKSEIQAATSCPDENGNLTLMAPTGFAKYTWSNGQTGQNISVKANLGDTYHVSLIPLGSLNESCALNLDYTINFKQSSASISRTICEGGQVAVGDTVYKTSGTFVRNVSKSNVCDSTVTLTLTVNKAVKYTQNIRICEGDSIIVGDTAYADTGTYIKNIPQSTGCDSIVTTNLEVIKIGLSVDPILSIIQGDSVQIKTLLEPSGNYTFVWSPPANLSCTDCPQPWSSPDASTVYNVSIGSEDQTCHVNASVKVLVKPCGISIPDAFSPNQDQVNEVFYVFGDACVRRIKEMIIYNRWGEVVFRNSNFNASDPAQGWNGTYHGKFTPSGVYPYKIKVELNSGNLRDYTGAVNLLK